MPIRFTCPACKAVMEAPDNAGGKQSRCPRCTAAVEIPVPRGEILDSSPHVTPQQPQHPPPPVQDQSPEPFAFDESEPAPPSARDRSFAYDTPRRRQRNSGNGVVALVLGIVGLVVMPLASPIAIFVANGALREDPNDGTAKAGLILGWIGTIILVLGCCLIGGLVLMTAGG